jgi:hypothetical protein
MGHDGHAETSAASTWSQSRTHILCPTCWIFLPGSLGARFLAKLTLERVIIKYQCTQLTSEKPPSAHRSGCSSFAKCLSGCATLATPQRMMNRILAGLSFVFCYLDDIIIASSDEQEHLEHLREVFSGLVINAEKCVFAATAVEFLGHKVSAA